MLELVGASKTYPVGKGKTLRALDPVDFSLATGITQALVGESGSGKSTMAKLMLRLEKPTAGKVLFEGRDVWEMDRASELAYRRAVQMIFQDPYSSLNPRMSVGSIVGEGLLVHGLCPKPQIPARVGELLATVGLDPDVATRYPRQFSGGQRQRISIARALAVSPRFLVADEPVSALDVSVQAQVLNLLQEIKDGMGLGLLFISHDLRVVRAISDEVLVMYLGTIVESGPTAELFANPLHPYTRMLLEAAPEPDPQKRHGKFKPIGDQPSPIDRPAGCPFVTRCPQAMQRCGLQAPPNTQMPTGARVRCFLYG